MVAGNRGKKCAFKVMAAAMAGKAIGGRPPKRVCTDKNTKDASNGEAPKYQTPSRPAKRGSYTKYTSETEYERLKEAIEACTGTGRYATEGKMPVRRAVKRFEVKRSTLQGYLKKVNIPKRNKDAPDIDVNRSTRLLNNALSQKLAQMARKAAKKGRPYDYEELRLQGRILLKRSKKYDRKVDESRFSNSWAINFAVQHKLEVRRTQKFAQNRADAVSQNGFRKAGIYPMITAEEWIENNKELLRLEKDGVQTTLFEHIRREATIVNPPHVVVCRIGPITIYNEHLQRLCSTGAAGEMDDAIIQGALLHFKTVRPTESVFVVDSVAVKAIGWNAFERKFRNQINAAELVLMPIHEISRHHWWMAAYRRGDGNLLVMDSLPSGNNSWPSLPQALDLVELSQDSYKVVEIGKQTNSYDCGVFTILCGYRLIHKVQVNMNTVNQSLIEWTRKHLMLQFHYIGHHSERIAETDTNNVTNVVNDYSVDNSTNNYHVDIHIQNTNGTADGLLPISAAQIKKIVDQIPPNPRKNLVGQEVGAPCIVNSDIILDVVDEAKKNKQLEAEREDAKRKQKLIDEACARQVLTVAGVPVTTKITINVLKEYLEQRGVKFKSNANRSDLLNAVANSSNSALRIDHQDDGTSKPNQYSYKLNNSTTDNGDTPSTTSTRAGDVESKEETVANVTPKETVQSLLPAVQRKMGIPPGSKVTVLQMKQFLGETKSGGSKLEVMKDVLKRACENG